MYTKSLSKNADKGSKENRKRFQSVFDYKVKQNMIITRYCEDVKHLSVSLAMNQSVSTQHKEVVSYFILTRNMHI